MHSSEQILHCLPIQTSVNITHNDKYAMALKLQGHLFVTTLQMEAYFMSLSNSKGFTLLEIIVVIVILIIGAAIALPNLSDMSRRDQARVAARQLKDQISRARADAVENNNPTIMIFNAASYEYGRDNNNDWALAANERITQVSPTNIAFAITNGIKDGLIQWNGKGYPLNIDGTPASGTISVTGAGNTFSIILSPAGAINITKP